MARAYAAREAASFPSMLPRIDFQDDATHNLVAQFECDSARRFSAARSYAGGVLKIPFMETRPSYRNDVAMLTVFGFLCWHGEPDGLLIPAQPVNRNVYHLETPFTDEQIERFEKRRAGAAPMLELRLRGVASVNGTSTPITTNGGVPIYIPVEEWLKILAMLGWGQRRLIELPPAPTGLGERWEDAAKALANAARRFAGGDVGVAMTEGRVALERTVEALGQLIGRPRNGEPVRNYFAAVALEVEKRHVDRSDDPFAVLADSIRLGYKIFGFTSDPVHNGVDAGERANAELALSLITALYTYFARLRPVVRQGGTDDGPDSLA